MKRRRLMTKANMLGGPQWFGGRQYAVLVDGGPDRVIGEFKHDGHGKWEMSVHVSYWRAMQLIRAGEAWFAGWAGFPRCCLCLPQVRNAHDAGRMVEELSGVRMSAADDVDWPEVPTD